MTKCKPVPTCQDKSSFARLEVLSRQCDDWSVLSLRASFHKARPLARQLLERDGMTKCKPVHTCHEQVVLRAAQ
eukprot:56179-Eustigmatos_ZCMA.PRE.1